GGGADRRGASGAHGGSAGGVSGGLAGGLGLSAARSRGSAAAAARTPGGGRGRGGADGASAGGSAGRLERAAPLRGGAAPAGRPAPGGAGGREPRLCPLHLRLHRKAQGRDGDASRLAQLRELVPARIRARRNHDGAGSQPARLRPDGDLAVGGAGGGRYG